jgi:protein RecA
MSTLDEFAKELEAAIGGNDARQAVSDYIDTGFPPLNKIICGDLAGGIPQGRLMEMYGPSSSGKTAIATKWMIHAQQQGGVAGFMDHERSFDVELAKSMGLRDEFPFWIYKRPKTWEESNMLMAKAAQAIRKSKTIPEKAPIFFVFDSIAAAVPKSTAEKEIDEYNMNDTTALARVTSTTLKSIAQYAEQFNFTVLYLNQIRTKPGVVYGDPTTTPGGMAMEFYSTLRIALSRKKIVDENKVFIGQEITMKTVKNKMTRPFQEVSFKMMFDELGNASFDVTASTLDWLIAKEKLVMSGPRVMWIDGKSYHKKALVAHIEATGQQAELVRLCHT